ncbi:Vacuole effluxer Atg22-like protein [Aureococcus anophagefferens]|nr:Vacuole effluxer Atg22-like protein [Aureococcus anophagefferens]
MGYLTLGTWRVAASASYLWDNLCAGCVLSTNIFFNIALLKLATIAAGCRPEGNDDDGACTKHVYGLKPSSLVTTVVMVGQLSAAFLMPFVGAAVDYTDSRRLFGSASAWILAVTTLLQAVISRRTWQLVACLQVVSIASYVCHQVAVLSYLPGLSVVDGAEDEHERYRVNSMANVAALGSQMGTLGVVMALAHGHQGPARGRVLAAVAVREVFSAWQTIQKRSPAAGRFLLGYALVNGGMTGFGSLAVVFMNDHLKMESADTVAVVGLTIVFAIPAAALAVRLMDRLGARRTFVASIAYMTAVTVAAPVVLCGPSCRSLVFLFAFFWGLGFGVFYASNTSFFTELVPGDAISQFMSLYYFSAQVLSWAPPAVYTLLNQLTSETHLSLFVLAAFFAASLPTMMGPIALAPRWRSALAAFALLAVAAGDDQPCVTDRDVILVVDRSVSITKEGWNDVVLDTLYSFIDSFAPSVESNVRLGIVVFPAFDGKETRTTSAARRRREFDVGTACANGKLNDGSCECDPQGAANSTLSWPCGGWHWTPTWQALWLARRMFLDLDDVDATGLVDHDVYVVTDGAPAHIRNDDYEYSRAEKQRQRMRPTHLTLSAATDLKDTMSDLGGGDLFGVGVGPKWSDFGTYCAPFCDEGGGGLFAGNYDDDGAYSGTVTLYDFDNSDLYCGATYEEYPYGCAGGDLASKALGCDKDCAVAYDAMISGHTAAIKEARFTEIADIDALSLQAFRDDFRRALCTNTDDDFHLGDIAAPPDAALFDPSAAPTAPQFSPRPTSPPAAPRPTSPPRETAAPTEADLVTTIGLSLSSVLHAACDGDGITMADGTVLDAAWIEEHGFEMNDADHDTRCGADSRRRLGGRRLEEIATSDLDASETSVDTSSCENFTNATNATVMYFSQPTARGDLTSFGYDYLDDGALRDYDMSALQDMVLAELVTMISGELSSVLKSNLAHLNISYADLGDFGSASRRANARRAEETDDLAEGGNAHFSQFGCVTGTIGPRRLLRRGGPRARDGTEINGRFFAASLGVSTEAVETVANCGDGRRLLAANATAAPTPHSCSDVSADITMFDHEIDALSASLGRRLATKYAYIDDAEAAIAAAIARYYGLNQTAEATDACGGVSVDVAVVYYPTPSPTREPDDDDEMIATASLGSLGSTSWLAVVALTFVFWSVIPLGALRPAAPSTCSAPRRPVVPDSGLPPAPERPAKGGRCVLSGVRFAPLTPRCVAVLALGILDGNFDAGFCAIIKVCYVAKTGRLPGIVVCGLMCDVVVFAEYLSRLYVAADPVDEPKKTWADLYRDEAEDGDVEEDDVTSPLHKAASRKRWFDAPKESQDVDLELRRFFCCQNQHEWATDDGRRPLEWADLNPTDDDQRPLDSMIAEFLGTSRAFFRGRDTFPTSTAATAPRSTSCPWSAASPGPSPTSTTRTRSAPRGRRARVDAAVASRAACRRVEPPRPRLKDIVDEVLTNAREEGRPAREVFEVIDPAGARALAPADFVRGLRELDTDRLLDADGRRPTLEFLGFVEPFERHGDGKVHMAPFETYCAALQAPPWARDAASKADALPPLAASATRAPSPREPRAAAPAAFRTTF